MELTIPLLVNPYVYRILKIQAKMKEESLPTRVEDKGRSMEKELGTNLEDLPISPALNSSLMWHEVSFVELELFLESYLSLVSIIGDSCAISFGDGLFLVVPSTSKFVSSYNSLKNKLVINDVSGEPACFDCDLVHDDSFFDATAGGSLEFDCASFNKLLLKDFENQMGTSFEMFKFEELKRLLICGKEDNSSLKVLKVHLRDFVKTNFEDDVFSVKNTSFCVKLLNQSIGGTLLYYLIFTELLDELTLKRGFKIFERQDLRANPFKKGGLEDDGNPPKLLMVHCPNIEKPKEQVVFVEEDQVLLKARSLGDEYEDLVSLKILNHIIILALE
ncbi:hypothetical protein M9H77_13499 [Catharanthus roseus]|uniref:Uncharacterized protein n=1 Tax=Catharanthus roseus TaxID=4058 RepID=A0ACC0BKE4_CATRO|nr:hypothetical protein M9H77_13499 [Catharanthus roseus]